MEGSTTMRQMLATNRIFVPVSQKGFSWDTQTDLNKTDKQVNMFLSDLENHIKKIQNHHIILGIFYLKKKKMKD